jgi:YHS domain-containing protein
VEYDLRIIPVLWKFDSHAEFSSPIAAFDAAGLAKWLDDRIVRFVELFILIHEGELVDRADFVEDPISQIKFPKFAAGATLEHGGQTHYFIDETTKAEFARRQGLATA